MLTLSFPKSGRYVNPHHPYRHLAQSGGRRVVQISFGSLTFKGPPLPARSAISRPICSRFVVGFFLRFLLWMVRVYVICLGAKSLHSTFEASRYVCSAWELSCSLRSFGAVLWWCSGPAYVGRGSPGVHSRSFFRLRLWHLGTVLRFPSSPPFHVTRKVNARAFILRPGRSGLGLRWGGAELVE